MPRYAVSRQADTVSLDEHIVVVVAVLSLALHLCLLDRRLLLHVVALAIVASLALGLPLLSPARRLLVRFGFLPARSRTLASIIGPTKLLLGILADDSEALAVERSVGAYRVWDVQCYWPDSRRSVAFAHFLGHHVPVWKPVGAHAEHGEEEEAVGAVVPAFRHRDFLRVVCRGTMSWSETSRVWFMVRPWRDAYVASRCPAESVVNVVKAEAFVEEWLLVEMFVER